MYWTQKKEPIASDDQKEVSLKITISESMRSMINHINYGGEFSLKPQDFSANPYAFITPRFFDRDNPIGK
jgi:hypothetical protein